VNSWAFINHWVDVAQFFRPAHCADLQHDKYHPIKISNPGKFNPVYQNGIA
jgi:hypothetical protein